MQVRQREAKRIRAICLGVDLLLHFPQYYGNPCMRKICQFFGKSPKSQVSFVQGAISQSHPKLCAHRAGPQNHRLRQGLRNNTYTFLTRRAPGACHPKARLAADVFGMGRKAPFRPFPPFQGIPTVAPMFDSMFQRTQAVTGRCRTFGTRRHTPQMV